MRCCVESIGESSAELSVRWGFCEMGGNFKAELSSKSRKAYPFRESTNDYHA